MCILGYELSGAGPWEGIGSRGPVVVGAGLRRLVGGVSE